MQIHHKMAYRVAFFSFIMLLMSHQFILGQDIPEKTKDELQQYETLIERYINEQDHASAAQYLNKSAFIYWNYQKHEKAIDNFEKALEYSKKMNNKNGMMIIYYNLGMIYSDIENFAMAESMIKNGLAISKNINDKSSIASGLTNVAMALQGQNKHEEAIGYLEEAIDLSKELNNMKLLRRSYGMIYESYETTGNSDKAFEYFEIYQSFDRKIKKEEMEEVKTIAKTEVDKAQAEKQQTENVLNQTNQILRQTADSLEKAEILTREQRLEIELNKTKLREKEATLLAKEAQIRARNQLIGFVLFVLVIMVFFAIILLRQNKAIKNQKEKIEDQRDKLEQQNIHIRSSIEYATNIQQAILPDTNLISNHFESFILYRPKDIVSGDFYWFSHFPSANGSPAKTFIAAVDCTGHGVPGAFMSMIGNRLLNEIVNERKIFEPNQILETLNKEVHSALRQDQTDNHDGMDLGLCVIEKGQQGKLKLVYSGAKRPLFIIKQENKKNVVTLKGDRKSIGGHGKSKEIIDFSNKEMEVSPGDMLYLSSDGIIDQNGPSRIRFGTKKLLKLLEDIANFPMSEQKEKIEYELDAYMEGEEQRDDITLLGIKLMK
jgi:serine phosphatase RsbU (regulator of sigma subunit)